LAEAAAALVSAIFFLPCAAPAQAHELGANRVEITVTDEGRYDIAIVSNPEALLARLELLHGDAADMKEAGTNDERLARLGETLLAHLHLRADDAEMKPEVVPGFHRVPAAAETGADEWAVRLRGRLPAGAERVTWQCGFIYGSYAVVVRAPAVSVQWTFASERTAAMTLESPRQPSAAVTVWRFVREGFRHILARGLDHVLFVLGVFLLSTRLRTVVAQLSAFTVAHSITFGLSMYGIMSLPPGIVEPAIALSIAYVAVENLTTSRLRSHRVALVFAFGLLHGLGFAGALSALALPRSQFLFALVGFNVGVEAGQIAVVVLALAASAPWRRSPVNYRRFVLVPSSIAIAAIGLFWTIQRVVAA
jgi:hydrogenase/urease accessory protein HupE